MELVEIIYKNLSDYQSYKDLYDTCRSILSDEQAVAVDYMRKLNEKIKERLQVTHISMQLKGTDRLISSATIQEKRL